MAARKERFLIAYALSGNVKIAAKAAEVGRATHYEWLAADPAYAIAVDAALEEAHDALEAEARRRAVVGTLRPVFQGGKEVGVIREYSDRLLEVLLRAARPHKFRENVKVDAEVAAPGGGPIEHAIDVTVKLDPAFYAKVITLADSAGLLGEGGDDASPDPAEPVDRPPAV